jgi:hypothetical protein
MLRHLSPFFSPHPSKVLALGNFHRCEGIEETHLVGAYQITRLVCHEIARISRVFLATWELAGEKHIACVFIAISFVTNYAFSVLSGPYILLSGSSAAPGTAT